jgi:outer membrane protein assembly factor BamA
VRYVVVTKDLWSLRAGWDGRFNKGKLEYLSVQPTERNLFGTGRQAFGTLSFGRRTYSVGLGYVEPRLAGSRTRILVQANAIVSCDTGDVEGSSGGFQYSRPLYSTRAPWSYATSVSWSNSKVPLTVVGGAEGSICSARSDEEIPVPLPSDRVALMPNHYQYDSQSFSQSFTRSYGYQYKTNLGFGLEAIRNAAGETDLSRVRATESDVPGELTENEVLAVQAYYRRFVPRSDARISPFFQVTSFTTQFHRDINSETLALQEDVDFRLGHIASLRLYPALRALGSTRNLLGIQTSASYALSVGTGYLKARASHDVEISHEDTTDATLSVALRFTSPRMALGRFVYDARLLDHYHNYRRTNLAVGGTGRLRGYRNQAAVGSHYVASNLEFRTRPVELLGAQLAAVAFHDVGAAFDDFSDMRLLQGVGLGLRFLAPQLDRDVFRLDLGFPVPLNQTNGEITLIATFGQAFGLP